MLKRPILTAILLTATAASTASAQLLGGGGLGGPIGGVIRPVTNTVDRAVGDIAGPRAAPSSYINPARPVSLDAVGPALRQLSVGWPGQRRPADRGKCRIAARHSRP